MRKLLEFLPIGVFLLWLSIVGLVFTGWVFNIQFLMGLENVSVTIPLVLRIIGVVIVPLGSLLGWIL